MLFISCWKNSANKILAKLKSKHAHYTMFEKCCFSIFDTQQRRNYTFTHNPGDIQLNVKCILQYNIYIIIIYTTPFTPNDFVLILFVCMCVCVCLAVCTFYRFIYIKFTIQSFELYLHVNFPLPSCFGCV